MTRKSGHRGVPDRMFIWLQCDRAMNDAEIRSAFSKPFADNRFNVTAP